MPRYSPRPLARSRRTPLLGLRSVVPLLAAMLIGCASAAAPTMSSTAPAPAAGEPARLALVDGLVPAPPAAVGMDPALPAHLDSIVQAALAEGVAPGVSIAVGRHGRLIHHKGYGTLDYAQGSPAVDGASIYDLASLTKVIATTSAAMILEEEGKLDINRTVHSYLPEFDAPDKAPITVRMLLTHSGGLEAGAPLWRRHRGQAEYLTQINTRPLRAAPGTQTIYSDWDYVLLQAIVERISGTTLDAFAGSRLFAPLGMTSTRFRPDTTDAALRRRIAPTAFDSTRGGLLWGVVHDGNAWALGGVSGLAGLFATSRDVAVFAQTILHGGTFGGTRIVSPRTLARWLSPQLNGSSRALGWDTPGPLSSAGRHFSPRSVGHTGYTGTSLWIDPDRSLFVVVLANRVNSRGESTRHAKLRRDVADAVQSAVLDAPLIDWEARR